MSSVEDIIQYLKANQSQFPVESLVNQLRKAGHREKDIAEALRSLNLAVPQSAAYPAPSAQPVSTGMKIWKGILGFIVGELAGGLLGLLVRSLVYFSGYGYYNNFWDRFGSLIFYIITFVIAAALPIGLFFYYRTRSRYFALGLLIAGITQIAWLVLGFALSSLFYFL